MYIVVGLGNPGTIYEKTRHNVGKLAVDFFDRNKINLDSVQKKIKIIRIDTYMNQSGTAISRHVRSLKSANKLIVIYDDLDLPIGEIRISFNRGSGGHRGVESIINSINSKSFIRIRIGISPRTIGGKIKKITGAQNVEKFILGEFNSKEMQLLEKVFQDVQKAIQAIVEKGLSQSMNTFNSTKNLN